MTNIGTGEEGVICFWTPCEAGAEGSVTGNCGEHWNSALPYTSNPIAEHFRDIVWDQIQLVDTYVTYSVIQKHKYK